MASDKKRQLFVFRKEWYDTIRTIDDDKARLELMDMIFYRAFRGEIPSGFACSAIAKAVFFGMIERQIVDDMKKREEISEKRREIGRKGGMSKVSVAKIDKANNSSDGVKSRHKEKEKCSIDFVNTYIVVDNSFVVGCFDSKKKFSEMKKKFGKTIKGSISKYIKSMRYEVFLRTTYWKIIADYVKKKAKYRCQLCNSESNLSVHHRTYRNHGDEINHLEDLICICNDCHKKQHDKK